jgi:hypothetical protein
MRKLALGFLVVLVICAGAYWRFHHRRGPVETAYVGRGQVTVWSSSALVKESLATANFGDRLEVLARSGEQAQVRTPSGIVGWVGGDELLSEEFWQKAKALLAETGKRPVEGRGRTRVIGNLHLDPARDSSRLAQLSKGVPLELFERRAVPVPVSVPVAPPATVSQSAPVSPAGSAAADSDAVPAAAPAKLEDWWLVKAKPPGQQEMAGWLLGRFIALDVPAPLPDYATAAGVRIVAWFELNRVPDERIGLVPQYLVLGAHGPEGQPCDFTLLRAYTWDQRKQRYETAFVESDLCGKLPIDLKPAAAPSGDANFAFEDWSGGTAKRRNYHMVSTSIRVVRGDTASPSGRKPKH